MMKRTILSSFLLFSISFLLNSCGVYRTPEYEDCLRSVPITNNPHITGDSGPSLFPGGSY